VSVGFRPLEAEARSRAEGRDVQGGRFKRAELLEISAMPVPMHPAALRKATLAGQGEDPFERLAMVVRERYGRSDLLGRLKGLLMANCQ